MDSYCEDQCCAECVRDPFLRARILAEGTIAQCDKCGAERIGVTLWVLAEWIGQVLEDHFQPGVGDSLLDTIQDIVGIDEDRAETIGDWLSSSAAHEASGGDTIYDGEGFVPAYRDLSRRDEGWDHFSQTVRARSRYFNRTAEEWLERIFGSLARDQTIYGTGVFKNAGPDDQITGFWRARQVATIAQAGEILASPAKLLGPLPAGKGSPGRLNSAGISVFYGALDTDTCVAEIRPPVGSIVVSGRFELVRQIRLLDLDLLEHVQAGCSHFDPDYHAKIDRALFLRAFGQTIARPVLPGEEILGYLPTQIVADYLAQRLDPRIDGIIYQSTQTGGTGRNVVLFEEACRVADDPPLPSAGTSAISSVARLARVSDGRPITLKIDINSLEISDIRATVYERVCRSASAWGYELEEQDHADRWGPTGL